MKKSNKDLDGLVLDALREEEGYVSGEELAQKFKISRQGLWKHIAKLTAQGYEIVAVPHLGYKLLSLPDKLYPYEIGYGLNTKFIGKHIQYYESIDSTQDVAWQLGLKNFPEGTIVVSESQKKGRGRLKRRWIAPQGGIYFSLILRPKSIGLDEISKITLLAAVSCLYGLTKVANLEYSLKWPNDILLDGKKLGGILCEIDAEQDRINFIILGIGINVNAKDLPTGAMSMFLSAKKRFSRIEIIKRILEQIEVLYQKAEKEKFFFILKEWKRFCSLWGNRVKVDISGRMIEGEAIGIDDKGHLLLRRDNGFMEAISAGDVEKVNVNQKQKFG